MMNSSELESITVIPFHIKVCPSNAKTQNVNNYFKLSLTVTNMYIYSFLILNDDDGAGKAG